MGLTKIGALLKEGEAGIVPYVPLKPPPKPPGRFRRGMARWGKAEMQGYGPLTLAANGAQVAMGETSLGGAIAGTAAATAAWRASDKHIAPRIKGGINTLVSKIPKDNFISRGIAKLPTTGLISRGLSEVLPRLPGGLGSIASFGSAMYLAQKANKIGDDYGNKFAPIWRKKEKSNLPNGMTPEQIIKYKQIIQRAGRTLSGGVPDLDTFQDIVS